MPTRTKRRAARPWSLRDEERLLRLLPLKYVAKALGRSESAVRAKIRRLGAKT